MVGMISKLLHVDKNGSDQTAGRSQYLQGAHDEVVCVFYDTGSIYS